MACCWVGQVEAQLGREEVGPKKRERRAGNAFSFFRNIKSALTCLIYSYNLVHAKIMKIYVYLVHDVLSHGKI